MAVPYTFGTATASIPLSQLDSNFATAITLGNTAIQLGNTVTTLNNMTLANVTISSGNITLTNYSATTANITTANVGTLIVTGNETVQGNTSVTGTTTAAKFIPTGTSVTGNGMYLPATNSVGISTAGTNAVYIDASQNVGIGQSTNLTSKLTVKNSITFDRYGDATEGLTISTNSGNAVYNTFGGENHVWQTAGTERVRFDTSGNVGIGTNAPATKLQVTNATAIDTEIRITNSQDANNVSIGKQGSSSFGQTAAGNGFLYTVSDWSIMSNGGAIKFATGGSTERMRINAGAPILCLAGGSTTATGTGIAFPATQSASSNANTLDDYEEGTWTPIIGGNATYLYQNARYTAIGNKVFIECFIQINVFGTGSATDISGLPFVTNSSNPLGTIAVGYFSSAAVAQTYLSATINAAGTAVNLRGLTAAGGTMGPANFFQNSAAVYFTGQYTVN